MTKHRDVSISSRSALGGIYSTPPMSEDVLWRRKGLCSSHPNPQLWTPDPPMVEPKSKEAIRICYDCPVMSQCRKWAHDHKEVWGVWGAESEGVRGDILKGKKPRGRKHREVKELVKFYAS